MTDYKQLCVELLDSAEELDDLVEGIRLGDYMPDSFTLQPMRAVLERARAALAEPEPDGPTGIEIASILKTYAVIEPQMGASRILHEKNFSNAAHAILARLGNHQGMLTSSMPQPIPVSERLPEMDDCDADGRCWVGYLVTEEMEDEDLNPSWELCQINPDDEYWLPANALPVPS